jgi:capsular exopolysaccharide synthesis family protein
MSKITKALEKAARERLQRTQEVVTAPSEPVTMPVTTIPLAATRVGEIAPASQIHIDPHIVSAIDAGSPIAEQYRILRTNLQSLKLKQGSKVIVITSAVNGEGKSVTALNLALTMARQENLRVVLVDADMRKSSIPRWLGLAHAQKGLSTVLSRDGELDGSLVSLQVPRLAVLPAGPIPDSPAELLESVNMKRLLAALRAQFDLVIIDAPPVLPVADPGIISSQADGVLLVVRAGKTQRRTVLEAKDMLQKMKANVLGCVLTHVEYYLPGYHKYYQYYRESAKDGKTNGRRTPPAPTTDGNSSARSN